MDIATERFPHIVESLNKLLLPSKTILLGEIVLLKPNGRDDFTGVSRICRSDPDLALAYQGLGDFPKGAKKQELVGLTSYYVYDIAFYNGEDLVRNASVRRRLSFIRSIFSHLDPDINLYINTGLGSTANVIKKENKLREALLRKYHVGPVKIYHTDFDSDLGLAKRLGAEGFVVLDADAEYGDKGYSFDGKAQRPSGIYKRKPLYEDEFIISGVYPGTGRNSDRLGGLLLEQVHSSTGSRVACGKCGGGFTDKQREELWEERDKIVGKTVKIEFSKRQRSRNGAYALRFPEYKGLADKRPDECIMYEQKEDDEG
jgi:ATP-dependent DNA ligase